MTWTVPWSTSIPPEVSATRSVSFSLESARELARELVEVAQGAGLPCSALLTDMNECLGRTAGNALEVREAIQVLTGESDESGLREVTLALAAELLMLGGVVQDQAAAAMTAAHALDSGAAAERFARMVAALGGPSDLLEKPDRHLPKAPVRQEVRFDRAGVVATIDAGALGLGVVALGGGGRRPTDAIDRAVGLAEVRGMGETVGPDVPFAIVHAATASDAAAAVEALRGAVGVVDGARIPAPAKIIERVPAPAIQP